jgi:DNA processing protein
LSDDRAGIAGENGGELIHPCKILSTYLQIDRPYWLAWAQIYGVGAITIHRLHEHFGDLASAWYATPAELLEVDGLGTIGLEKICDARKSIEPEDFIEQHLERNPHFWTPADPTYPQLLLETATAPPVLYYRGLVDKSENLGHQLTIGIVGTRDITSYGRRWTQKIAVALAEQGYSIISGLAEGVDTEAHYGCLAVGGRTVAVVGTGLDVVYPARNQALAEKIWEEGLMVSEYPAGTRPDRGHFPARNRIIAGLSRAVLVMEAPKKSGALITAHLANEFCRDVYVLPGGLDNPQSIGCLGLLDRGAQLILSTEQLLTNLQTLRPVEMPPAPAPVQQTMLPLFLPQPVAPPLLAPHLAKILAVVDRSPISFDAIVSKTAIPSSEVSSGLLELELENLVTQLPGMQYQRI